MNAVINSYTPGVMLALTASTTTVSITGARPGMCVYATPTSDPGAMVSWCAWISANDIITFRLYALIALTPNVVNWNFRVIP